MEEVAYGFISLVPIIIVLVVAIVTQRVLEPLLIGAITGYIILDGFGFLPTFANSLVETMADPDVVWVMVIPALFGALIKLFDRSNSGLAFQHLALRFVKNQKGSLVATYIFGIIIFIDEYMNALLVGGTMRNLTDKYNVPREVLASVTNSTGTPVAVLTPFSSWAVFTMGIFGTVGIATGNGFVEYLKTIPFMVYCMVSLVITFLFTIKKVPLTKYVKEAYKRAEKGNVFPIKKDSSDAVEEFEEELEKRSVNKATPRLINFIIPLVVLVGGTVLFDMDLIIGGILSILSCFILYPINGTMSYSELFDAFIKGVEEMVFLIILIIIVFVFVNANDGLGTIPYVIDTVQPFIQGSLLPAITLLVVAALAFSTGNFWGTIAIVLPIVMPLAEINDVNIFLTTGAVISGAVFGSHVCFFSDSVTLSSASTQVSNMDQIKVTLPYALVSLLISAIIFIGLGLIM